MSQHEREFLLQIEELIEHIFADLDELRAFQIDNRGTSITRVGRQLIDKIFRKVHSIKGSAASCHLEVVSRIAHEFENLLVEVRSGHVLLYEPLIDTFESATAALSESLSLAAAGVAQPSRLALFERLQAAAQSPAKINVANRLADGDREDILKNIPFEIWQSLAESEKQSLVSIAAEGNPIYVIGTSFDIASFDEQYFRLKEKLAEFGDVISTSPAVDDQHRDRINFRLLYASNTNPEQIKNALGDISNVVFNEIAGLDRDRKASASNQPNESDQGYTTRSLASLSNFVRTDLDKLDELISSTHDVLRTTCNALDVALSDPELSASSRRQLEKLNKEIRIGFLGVENELINLRMVSLGPTLQRAMRAGRAAARAAGREVDFEIVGGHLRLDKLLADAIGDPLVHLVRNAVDHGIESEEERLAAGKKARGTVRIEAVSEGSQSRLRVVDDGRGIDPQLISAAAVRLGMVDKSAKLDVERSLRLVFRPGFTTLFSASDVSGRGVGLDVVETAAEQVGGEVRVSSNPGQGTTFEIRLPVTFGLVATNVIVSAGIHYCIPAAQTLGIDAIDVIDGSSGANQLRQVSMRDLLGQPEEPDDSNLPLQLITCQFMDDRGGLGSQQTKCVGIVVDHVEGPQEVLVRSLGRHAGRWYGIAGATELKDGTVALVLDLPRLLAASSY